MSVFVRHDANPLLALDAFPGDRASAFNPGATSTDDGVLLLVRVEDRRGLSSLWVARSADGVSDWQIDGVPLLSGDEPWEEWGCEDPRLTWVPELGEWLITYTAYSHVGPAVALARTPDFRRVEKLGVILSPENKDAALFPRRFRDAWLMVHRPVSGNTGHMWLASSPDLVHWGHPTPLLEARPPAWWDGAKIGAGAQPIEIDEGWLLIYHGVKLMPGGPVYRVGACLLDSDEPWQVIGRSAGWLFGPEADYERTGDVPNVVFPCGAILRDDEVWIYYGAGDSTVCLATARLSEVLGSIESAATAGDEGTAPKAPVTDPRLG